MMNAAPAVAPLVRRVLVPTLHHRHFARPPILYHSHATKHFSSQQQQQKVQEQHQNQKKRRRPVSRLPIAAFVDLDNVAPGTHRRSDARKFVGPIIEFERRINNDNGIIDINDNKIDSNDGSSSTPAPASPSSLLNIRAFGNLSTRSWRTPLEKQHSVTQQEYIPWTEPRTTRAGNIIGGVAQSGLDKDGKLRCGICGCKLKLTKKDRRRPNFTLEDKLQKHMKIHTAEQRKRYAKMSMAAQKLVNKKKTARKSNNKVNETNVAMLLPPEERVKFEKYQSATVGLSSKGIISGVTKGGREAKIVRRNDLFRTLGELDNVRVTSAEDVDKALIRAAEEWMGEILGKREESESDRYQNKDKLTNNVDSSSAGKLESIDESMNKPQTKNRSGDYKGVLLVYSRDGDFSSLLGRAKRNGFLAVSATNGLGQTSSLLRNADVLLGPYGDWTTDGSEEETSPLTDSDSMTSGDENSEYDIRNVSSAPLDLLSMSDAASSQSSSSVRSHRKNNGASLGAKAKPKAGMVAIPISEDGLRFMRAREHQWEHPRWELTLADDSSTGPNVAHAENEANADRKSKDEQNVIQKHEESGGMAFGYQKVKTMLAMAFGGATINNVSAQEGKERSTLSTDGSRDKIDQSSFPKLEMEDDDHDLTATYATATVIASKEEPAFRERKYECNLCGFDAEKWRKFEAHRRLCLQCTPERRQWPMKKFVVYLDDDDDEESIASSGGSLDSANEEDDDVLAIKGEGEEMDESHDYNDDDDEDKEDASLESIDVAGNGIAINGEMDEPEASDNEEEEYDSDDDYVGEDDSHGNQPRKHIRQYKCHYCGHMDKRWLPFTRYRQSCTSCSRKNRKRGMKQCVVYLDDDGSSYVDHETFFAIGSASSAILPEMYVRKDEPGGIDLYDWKNPAKEMTRKVKRRRRKLRYRCKDCGHEAKLWRTMKSHMRKNCTRCQSHVGLVSRKEYEFYKLVE